MSTVDSTCTPSCRLCEFPGCGRKHHANGYCGAHNKQLATGRPLCPLYSTNRPTGSPPRILFDEMPCARSDLEGPCHVFRGAKCSDGYGSVKINMKTVGVHRFVWEQLHGPIPKGLEDRSSVYKQSLLQRLALKGRDTPGQQKREYDKKTKDAL